MLPNPCANQPGKILPFPNFSLIYSIRNPAVPEKKKIKMRNEGWACVIAQKSKTWTKAKITACKIFPVKNPRALISLLPMNPLNKISSEKEVFNPAVNINVKTELNVSPIALILPETVGGVINISLISLLIKASVIPPATPSPIRSAYGF